MSGKLMFGGLVAVAAMALTAETASAQRVVRHGNHFHTVSPGWGHTTGWGGPVVTAPIYTRPVFVSPGWGGGWGTPVYGGGWGRPVYGGFPGYGYGGGWGGGFNNGFYGRPSFGLSFNFIR